MNYCEGDTSLLKYDTTEDCWRFLVVKLIILCAILDTWDFTQSYFFLFFASFTFLFIIRLIGFIIPNFCKKKTLISPEML